MELKKNVAGLKWADISFLVAWIIRIGGMEALIQLVGNHVSNKGGFYQGFVQNPINSIKNLLLQ